MESQNSSAGPVSSDLSGRNSADGERSGTQIPKCVAVRRASWLWRLLHWPVGFLSFSWVRVRIAGHEHIDNDRGGLFLINHQSFLDPLFVAVRLSRPVCYLARDSLFRVPVIGWILRKSHVIPISREAARGGSIRLAIERLETGFLVGIFPEGTRSTDGGVHRFRPGFIAVIRRTSQPVYPVGIAGANQVMPKGAWLIRPGRIQVVFGPPLTPGEVRQFHSGTDDAELCELARSRVAECAKLAEELLKKP